MHSILDIIESTGTDGSSVDLISLEDLKLALGITGTEQDAELAAAITFHSELIAEYCDRRLAYAEAVEIFRFDRYGAIPSETLAPRQALTLSLYPIAEVTEVAVSDTTTTEYEFDPPSGRIWSINGSWCGIVAITYAGGYQLPDEAPARLQKAVIDSVNERLTSGTRDPSIREVQHGDLRISYFTSSTSSASPGFLSAPVVDLIRPYKRIGVA